MDELPAAASRTAGGRAAGPARAAARAAGARTARGLGGTLHIS